MRLLHFSDQSKNPISENLELIKRHRDVYGDSYQSASNLLNQLLSLKRGWNFMSANEESEASLFLFLRADLEYLDGFNLNNLAQRVPWRNSILVPEWHCWGSLNDRLSFTDFAGGKVSANRWNDVSIILPRSRITFRNFSEPCGKEIQLQCWSIADQSASDKV
jgi:hypothetical protein